MPAIIRYEAQVMLVLSCTPASLHVKEKKLDIQPPTNKPKIVARNDNPLIAFV